MSKRAVCFECLALTQGLSKHGLDLPLHPCREFSKFPSQVLFSQSRLGLGLFAQTLIPPRWKSAMLLLWAGGPDFWSSVPHSADLRWLARKLAYCPMVYKQPIWLDTQ
ncbi:hypothetical protein M434DRAFT_31252 [Hypoxylon sp. CO27-5]|nr:hypothetical protein M434DRAFT_31252 [Hypoxylon sp. CO27-5]